jgi:hypothetical protein
MLRDREIVLPGIARAAGGVSLLAPYPVWADFVAKIESSIGPNLY